MNRPSCIVASIALLACTGCASLSNRTKTVLLMASTGVAAGTVGAALTPPGENPLAHGALWGSVGAASMGLLGLYLFDEQALRRTAEEKNARLERELAAFREELEPELLATSQIGASSKPLPEKYRNLVRPGEWSLYRVDRWTTSGEGELVHQDLIFQFQQPRLNPSAAANVAAEPNGGR